MKPKHEEVNYQSFPIHECLINPSWQEIGQARVLLSRKISKGEIVFATFLVDLYCLGVKDVLTPMVTPKIGYESMKLMAYFDGRPLACDPNLAHTIIYGSIEYAQNLGFQPHEDFSGSSSILLPETDITKDTSVRFGQDGRVIYVEGPNDNPEYVIATLNGSVGKGNFDVVSVNDLFNVDE